MKTTLIFISILALFAFQATYAEEATMSPNNAKYIYGVTIDDISPLSAIISAIKTIPHKLAARVVFDEGMNPPYYLPAVRELKNTTFVMGEILDSSAMKQYSVAQYRQRAVDYINALAPYVDIWELGNEVNGEWLGNDVPAKIAAAYAVAKQRKVTTELTLYYNETCSPSPQYKMFNWAEKNISNDMKAGLDYVLVSYYQDDCEGPEPNWNNVFAKLHTMFPNSKLGFGEVGTKNVNKKVAVLKHFYEMQIQQPNYIGGYFWWFFNKDMKSRDFMDAFRNLVFK